MKLIRSTSAENLYSERINFKIENNFGDQFELKNLRTIKNLDLPTQTVNMDKMAQKLQYFYGTRSD